MGKKGALKSWISIAICIALLSVAAVSDGTNLNQTLNESASSDNQSAILIDVSNLADANNSEINLSNETTTSESEPIDLNVSTQELNDSVEETEQEPQNETLPEEPVEEVPEGSNNAVPEETPAAEQVPVQPVRGVSSVSELTHQRVRQLLGQKDRVSVIVKLKDDSTPIRGVARSVNAKNELIKARQAAAKSARDAFYSHRPRGVQSLDVEIKREYAGVSALHIVVNAAGLAELESNPAVEGIYPDVIRRITLTDSVPLVEADVLQSTIKDNLPLNGYNDSICVIDTGINFGHPAFVGKTLAGHDFINSDTNASDDNGHGSHVAGIAAGNASPVIGVAPGAYIVPVKVCNAGGGCPDSSIIAGVDYCNNNATSLNITVIVGSLGGGAPFNSTSCSGDSLFATLNPVLNVSIALGIIPVFASGNNGCSGTGCTTGVDYPACDPNSISVGSTSKTNVINSFTDRGGDRFDIWAPGGSIVSAAGTGIGTNTLSGTSMSAPHVGGMVAILQRLQRLNGKPAINLTAMRALLLKTGITIGSSNTTRIDLEAAAASFTSNSSVAIISDAFSTSITFGAVKNFTNSSICVNMSNNFAGINSSDSAHCGNLTGPAQIVLSGVSTPSTPYRDGVPCDASICTDVVFNGTALIFNVTSFSDFTSVPGCGATITENSTLTSNLTGNSSCIVFGASNIVFDCNGSSINFSDDGGGGSAIVGGANDNITIKNCILYDVNTTSAETTGVNLTGTTGSVVTNVTIVTNNTAVAQGISLSSAIGNVISFNNITKLGATGAAIVMGIGSDNTINNNNIFANGTGIALPSGFARFSNTVAANTVTMASSGTKGIEFSSANSSIIDNVVIGATGDGIAAAPPGVTDTITVARNTVEVPSGTGISWGATGFVVILNNTVLVNGSGSSGSGMAGVGAHTIIDQNSIGVHGVDVAIGVAPSIQGNVSRNNVTVRGTVASVAFSAGTSLGTDSSPSEVFNNTLDTNGSLSTAISDLNADGSNITFANNTLLGLGWMNFTRGATGGSANWSFFNTTFETTNTSTLLTNFSFVLTTAGSHVVGTDNLSVSFNRSFVNTSLFPQLNTTGVITLRNVSVALPDFLVDFEDDGTFAICSSPQCVLITNDSNDVTFNVSSFTTYAVTEDTLSCGDTITADTTLTSNISGSAGCIIMGADNIVLDCAGFAINYDASGGQASDAVRAENKNNISVVNCILNDTTSTGSAGIGINWTNVSDSTIVNVTIRTNGTSSGQGIRLVNSNRNKISESMISALGSAGSNIGILLSLSNNTEIRSNTVTTNGSAGSSNSGIQLSTAFSNNVTNNTVSIGGTGNTDTDAISLQGSDSNRVENNTIITTGAGGSPDNDGIDLGSADSNIIRNNVISVLINDQGIDMQSNSNTNTITSNNITSVTGIALVASGTSNVFDNNVISSSGSQALGFIGGGKYNRTQQSVGGL